MKVNTGFTTQDYILPVETKNRLQKATGIKFIKGNIMHLTNRTNIIRI